MKNLLLWLFSASSLPYWALAGLSWWVPKRLGRATRAWEKVETSLQRHPFVFLGGVSLALQIFFSVVLHWPEPRVHDEYSYLLAADTFSRGRLTNPAPALKTPFESLHIFLEPTYMSKYPPGQGLGLALGEVLFASPVVGAWGLAALAVILLAWALQPLLGLKWALRAGLLAAVHPLLLSWGQTFWGGSVALAGAAVLAGSLWRWRQKPELHWAICAALGLGILANSRPYEGLVFAGLSFLALVASRRARAHGVKVWFRHGCAGLLPVMILIFAWMGYYNYRVTGDWKKLPYMVHGERYNAAPQFVWMPAPRTPIYSRADLESLHAGYEKWEFLSQQGLVPLLKWKSVKASVLLQELFQQRFLILGILLAAGLAWKTCRRYFVFVSCFALAMLPVTYFNLHYFAPLIVWFLLICVSGFKSACEREWKGRDGAHVFAVLSLIWACGPGLAWQAFQYKRTQDNFDPRFFSWNEVEKPLRAKGGKHLLFLPCQGANCAVVHNDADLENTPILRARLMDDGINAEVVKQYPGRTLWVLLHEEGRYRVKEISGASRPLHSRNTALSQP